MPSCELLISGMSVVKRIMKLPAPARRLWNQSTKRVFNIGFQGGVRPRTLETEITSAAVEAAAAPRASIVVTIYALEETSLKRTTRRPKGR